MITDAAIREQGYACFLGEAPELLQTIEQDLYTLVESSGTAKIHNLMRATHTIKGGAANVGLDTIMTIAHSLEDIFKALYNPNVVIDSELQTLLVEGYECLQLAVTAEVTNSNINADELLNRATTVFVQIQEKLGDAFGAEPHIPTSEELGFDIVKSIFEIGVKQRLDILNQALTNPPDNTEFCELLHSQSEVFIGLAESLNLSGLEKLARTIMAALDANPQKVREIAKTAFTDLKAAQIAVLGGDRTSGGSPSLELQALVNTTSDDLFPVITTSSLTTVPKSESSLASIHQSFADTFFNTTTEFYQFLITLSNGNNQPLKPVHAKVYLKTIRYIFGWFNHYREIPESELNLSLLIPSSTQKYPVNYLEHWLEQFFYCIEKLGDSKSLCLHRRGVILIILLAIAKFQYTVERNNSAIPIIKKLRQQIRELGREYKNYPPVTEAEKNWLDHPKLQNLLVIKEIVPSSLLEENNNLLESIWGGEPILAPDHNLFATPIIETTEGFQDDIYLESVTSSAISEEVITDYDTAISQQLEEKTTDAVNRNSRQSSFVRVDVEGLQRLNYLTGELLIYQKRRTLYDEQVIELIDRLSQQLNQHQLTLYQLRDLPLQGNNVSSHHTHSLSSVNFDSLEMDVYSESQLTLHSAIEETLQIQETSESLELLMKQAAQMGEKQQTLTLNIIDNLVEARMLPLGTILSRFPQMVQNLANVYGKQVQLKLTGTDVLVDKAIAEKLYDPLLQLVRNSFDHGVESPEIRRERGKSADGTIEIFAYNQGSQTVIEIHDDGQGLNLEKVRSRAIELNLIPHDHDGDYVHHLTESELIEMMFAPGFSTAGKVSEISGRGMGLDIVRTQIQLLNGSISVQSSPQQGTTFILKIPFSMTTDKLMLVQAGGVIYALLQDSIEKIVIPSAQEIKEFEGKQFLYWRTDEDELMVNIQKLAGLMYYNGAVLSRNNLQSLSDNSEAGMVKNPIILLRRHHGMVGIEVDQIIGEQELVIRPLGNSITPPKYVYGCSSLANGNLILIIDGTLLIDTKEMQATLDVMSLPMALSPKNQQALLETVATHIHKQLTTNVLGNSQSPKVILVVDDAISLRQTLCLTLQKAGYQVLQAQNGVEALEQLHLHPEIEVIISDLEMPRMNGFELLSHIRQNRDLARKPVIVLTSRSAEKHRQLAYELGANSYLTKPYLEHEFLSTLESLANRNNKDTNQGLIAAGK
ncbi:hybrid sensor histidine kinase/response regulator [Dolichospermum sp. LEGE 00240]|uniref:hybrid sensor histidine kinase/response regulator n=1 Tax=Dolichospermum sp. LEGE 00240 TaxID=1828603 RepID=UPI00187F738E|nr:hybrid sensor histidine kinase/response regulator [Dolichospermum sp. LEGE 00240]MBE9248692.1 hybrid sensor histidine kinase/response regulator [Dolichospermum sp. LEGE 00240]